MIRTITEKSTALPSDRWSIQRMIREASQHDSVLDIGCGTGKVIKSVKAKKRYGVDANRDVIAAAKKHNNGVTFRQMDLLDFIYNSKTLWEVECIVGIDIIEHFTEQDAVQLILMCEGIASKCLMFFVPVGYHPQTKDDRGFGNDHYQTHRSTWYPQMMERLGYDVWHYLNWHKKIKPPKEKGAMFCRKILA